MMAKKVKSYIIEMNNNALKISWASSEEQRRLPTEQGPFCLGLT